MNRTKKIQKKYLQSKKKQNSFLWVGILALSLMLLTISFFSVVHFSSNEQNRTFTESYNSNSIDSEFDTTLISGAAIIETASTESSIQDFSIADTTATCGLVSTNTTLTANVNSTSNCFNITASNIILDCANFNITGDDSGTEYGIYISGQDNVLVKNCNIKKFYVGIYAFNSSD